MKHGKHKSKSKHEKKSKRSKKHKKSKHSDSEDSTTGSEVEQEWVEKPTSQSAPESQEQSEPPKREEWMDMKSLFPCVFNEKKKKTQRENDKPDLDKLGQHARELNPYWKNGGNGLPKESAAQQPEKVQVTDASWLKKSHRRSDSAYPISSHSGRRNWQKRKPEDASASTSRTTSSSDNNINIDSISDIPEIRGTHPNISTARKSTSSNSNVSTGVPETGESKFLTEAEMNKLGAKIAKAEIMGNNELADELKNQLRNAREAAKNGEARTEEVQVILTETDAKGNTRPLEPRDRAESSHTGKRKNAETHAFGKKVRHYFDDDKYSLQRLFQKEKGRSANEDDAEFLKVASKTMDMDEIFEEQISRVKSDAKQDERDRSRAIGEHKRLSKSLDNCQWCIDSKHMLKHMIVTMDTEICISIPRCTSLTPGHCVITPTHHVSCQLQLDENVFGKLKMYKQALYKMFTDQDQYPVFYEVYKSRYKYSHMQLICVPLPKKVGELAPMYFKKALLECEIEWSMNKKVISLERKDVRHAVPNGLSYFMVEFERDKGYAHVIEDEELFPKNFAEEIIAGMLDLNHDTWRRPRKENFDQQREKVLRFSEMWKKYEDEVKGFD